MAACPKCATPLPADAVFCPRCGASTPTPISGERAASTVRTPNPSGAEATSARRAELQRALGTAFQVKDLIGQGGFGEVWAATDVNLRRDVAVKVLRQDLVASPSMLERFRREAEAAAKLRHPNIVPIYQVGEAEGLVYFVMPLIKGESLRAVLERDGRLEVAEAVRILTEAASALHEAHEAGIVHRDIKPDNILLEGSQRRVLLMDFGIAKSLEAEDGGLTGTGMVIGTPQYMSPEQASGEKHIDARSDLYSLGVVAYQMLAGRLPFEADSAQGMIVAHITAAPDPIDKVRTGVPEELAAAVMRALAKKPGARWLTAAEFAEAIQPSVPVSGESPIRWITKWLRHSMSAARRRLQVYGLLAAVSLAGIVLLDPSAIRSAWHFWSGVLGAWRFGDMQPGTSRAALPWRTASHHRDWFVVPIGDSAVLVGNTRAYEGAAIYNGTSWRPIPIPGSIVPKPVFAGGRLWVISWDGRWSHVYEASAEGAVLRDSLGDRVTHAIGFDSTLVLGIAEGGVIRGRPGRWRREPTGVRGRFETIWGDRRRQAAVVSSPTGATLLVYDGSRWRSQPICLTRRPGGLRCWYVHDGAARADGTLLAVGSETILDTDTQEVSHRGLLLELPPDSAAWRSWGGSLPEVDDFGWVGALDSVGVWLASQSPSLVGATRLFYSTAGRVDTTDDLRGRVSGMALVRRIPTVLGDDGVLWAVRNGALEVATEAPSSIVVGCEGWFCWSASTFLPDRSAPVAAVVEVRSARDSSERWWLGQSGRLLRELCMTAANNREMCTLADTIPAPGGDAVTGIRSTGQGLVAVAGRRIWRWSGGWRSMTTSGVPPGSFLEVASGEGNALAALSLDAVWRWDSVALTWTRWHSLPSWVGRPRRIAIDPHGTVAVIVGDGAVGVVRSTGLELMQAGVGAVSAVILLADRRAVMAIPSVDDPQLGGRILITSPLDRSPVSTEAIDAPEGSDVYWLGRRAVRGREFVRAAGSGSLFTEVRSDALPFSKTAWGAIEIRNMPVSAWAFVDVDLQLFDESGNRNPSVLAEPGRHSISFMSEYGEFVAEKTATVRAGQTTVIRYP